MRSSATNEWRDLPGPLPAIAVVAAEIGRLGALHPVPRPERLTAVHNPWSNSAVAVDHWAFLDLCESDETVSGAANLIGSDVVLWDSQIYLEGRNYADFVAAGREGRYWPVHPREGVVSLVSFGPGPMVLHRSLSDLADLPGLIARDVPLYVIRYFPGSSKFVRKPRFPANWIAMEEQVLTNYATRALWLVSGVDRAGNDFVTGFSEQSASWSAHT